MASRVPDQGVNFSSIWSSKRASEAASRQQRAQTELDQLQEQVDKLTLICMAMWSLVREKTQLGDEELLRRIQEIDLADGELDGRIGGQLHNCPECGQTLSKRFKRCMYCGYEALDTFPLPKTVRQER